MKLRQIGNIAALGVLALSALALMLAAGLAGLQTAHAQANYPVLYTPGLAPTVRPTNAPYIPPRPTQAPVLNAEGTWVTPPEPTVWWHQVRLISLPPAFAGLLNNIDGIINPRLDVWAGDIARITILNQTDDPQQFSLPSFNFLSPDIAPGDALTIEFTPQVVGEFEYTVGNQALRDAGMRGVLRVAGEVEVGSRVGDIFAAAEATVIVCETTPEGTPAP